MSINKKIFIWKVYNQSAFLDVQKKMGDILPSMGAIGMEIYRRDEEVSEIIYIEIIFSDISGREQFSEFWSKSENSEKWHQLLERTGELQESFYVENIIKKE